MLKILLFSLIFLLSFAVYGQNTKNKSILYSKSEDIQIIVNNKITNWTISPEIDFDILEVYCENENNKVSFVAEEDSISFQIKNHDTIRFAIILNKDTAFTGVVGVKDVPNSISKEDKLYFLSLLWSETKYNFVNIDRVNFDIDSLFRLFIPIVLQSENDLVFYRTLNRFMAKFNDGHTEVNDNGLFLSYQDYFPVLLKDFEKKIYIVQIREGIGLDSTFIGAEIIEIENIPILEYMNKEILPNICASTEQHRWFQGVNQLHYDLKTKPFKAKVKKTNGEIKNIELIRNGESTRTKNDKILGIRTDYDRSLVKINWLEDSIAHLCFNRFWPEDKAISLFYKLLPELAKAKALIIDLRKNGGGSTEVGWMLQSVITPKEKKYFLTFGSETRINDGAKRANGNWIEEYEPFFLGKAYEFEAPDTIFISDTILRINIPTVILMSRYTFSAAEDFLVNIYEIEGRPMMIGEETGGSTGSPLVLPDLPGGGYARICTRRITFPYSNKPFVNSGIKPDIEVYPSIEDLLLDNDTVLERGINEVRKLINGK